MKRLPLPRRITRCLILAAAILILSCCHRARIPAHIVQPDTMVHFLTEAYLLEGFYAIEANYNYTMVAPQLQASYDSLLRKYHITDSLFRASLDFYTRHPELYDTIHARAIRSLDGGFTEQ